MDGFRCQNTAKCVRNVLRIIIQMKKWDVKFVIRLFTVFCILLLMLAGSVFLYYHSPEEERWLICVTYKLSGYYCPGCGAGRACYSILHGRFYQAFRYNPLLCILLPWFSLYFGICGGQWLLYGRETVNEHIPVWVPYVILVLVILYGILRNVAIYPFTLLAPVRVW